LPLILASELEVFARRLLLAAGVRQDEAETLASLLVRADLRGYPGHGVAHLPAYFDRIDVGLINVHAESRVLREGKTTAVIDADFGIGQMAAMRAIDLAIAKAREHGVGIVTVRHSGHVGRLGDYVERAAESGMIGYAVVSLGGGNVAPYGAMEPVSGTNPMAFGIPGRNGQHIVLDFATAALSMGEMLRHVGRGEPLPDGVMLDGYGNPTSNYRAFAGPPRGATLAFGGHKGSGLQLVAEMLAGLLSGNGLARDWRDRGASAINAAFFEAIAVEEFMPLAEYLDLVEDLRQYVHSRRPRPVFEEVLLPGERSRRVEAEQRIRGIEIDQEDWSKLITRSEQLGVTPPPTLAEHANVPGRAAKLD